MFDTINWELLRRQKQWLLTEPVSSNRDGLLALLDGIQDHAVDELGYTHKEVFGFTLDEAMESVLSQISEEK